MRKPFVDKGGYRRFTICEQGRVVTVQVHTLVLEAFLGPRPEGLEARHLDGDPSNNQVTNLRWGTRSENMQDRLAHGKNPMLSKTHCKRNHEYTEENTYTNPRGQRSCRICTRARQRK